MEKNKRIPTKNYIILGITTIIVIILTLYINAWIKTYKENKISTSPFNEKAEEVNINEIGLTLSEMNEVILYVGYTNDKTIYEMEEKLLSYIKKHNLMDKFIYVNATDYKENKEYMNILKNTFENKKDEIKNIPILIYVKNGIAEEVINSTNKQITTYDIANLNEKYGLEN